MATPVEAELVTKAAQHILRTYLDATIDQVTAEWASAQTLAGMTLAADPLAEFVHVDDRDVIIGRADIVDAESNFPTIQIFVDEETPEPGEGGEQNWMGATLNLMVRVLVGGLTLEHTEKLLYRYEDAVFRTLMNYRSLLGAILDFDPAHILYTGPPEDPLFKAVQLTFTCKVVKAW